MMLCSSFSLLKKYEEFQDCDESELKHDDTGLSMNILHAGDKSPAQRGFFKNSTGDLLPALRFLGRLCNFCNYTFFNHNGM